MLSLSITPKTIPSPTLNRTRTRWSQTLMWNMTALKQLSAQANATMTTPQMTWHIQIQTCPNSYFCQPIPSSQTVGFGDDTCTSVWCAKHTPKYHYHTITKFRYRTHNLSYTTNLTHEINLPYLRTNLIYKQPWLTSLASWHIRVIIIQLQRM